MTRHPLMIFTHLALFALALIGCGGGKNLNYTVSPIASSAETSQVQTSTASTSANQSSSSSGIIAVNSEFKEFVIDAPALLENLIFESTQRKISVYLPKAYFSGSAPLPVIYYLPGFGDSSMLGITTLDLDKAFNTYQPSIIVTVSGINRFGGSFFVDSPVTGKWEEFIVKDVVNYIDNHYRTVPKPEARGLAGHSMGGFGALNIAMHHPDIFGSVFSFSPGLVGAAGIADTQMFDSDYHIKQFVNSMGAFTNLVALQNSPDNFDIAYGMAFAPTTKAPYFEYPYSIANGNLQGNNTILAKWEGGFGAIHSEVTEFKNNLKLLNGIQLDCGSNDEYQWIFRGCNFYDAELTAANINHSYTTHSGQHQDKLAERIQTVMIPFFSQHLATK